MIDNKVNVLQDKDKLIIVVNVYVSDSMTRQDRICLYHEVYSYYKNMFDNSVKVLVFPVFEKEMQKIELLNIKGCDDELVKKMNENFEKFVESINYF